MTTMTSETLLESYSLLTCHCQCQTSFCDEKFQNLDIHIYKYMRIRRCIRIYIHRLHIFISNKLTLKKNIKIGCFVQMGTNLNGYLPWIQESPYDRCYGVVYLFRYVRNLVKCNYFYFSCWRDTLWFIQYFFKIFLIQTDGPLALSNYSMDYRISLFLLLRSTDNQMKFLLELKILFISHKSILCYSTLETKKNTINNSFPNLKPKISFQFQEITFSSMFDVKECLCIQWCCIFEPNLFTSKSNT